MGRISQRSKKRAEKEFDIYFKHENKIKMTEQEFNKELRSILVGICGLELHPRTIERCVKLLEYHEENVKI